MEQDQKRVYLSGGTTVVPVVSGEKRNIVQQCANGIGGEGTQLGHRKIDPDSESERISQLRGIAEARGRAMLVLRSKSIFHQLFTIIYSDHIMIHIFSPKQYLFNCLLVPSKSKSKSLKVTVPKKGNSRLKS